MCSRHAPSMASSTTASPGISGCSRIELYRRPAKRGARRRIVQMFAKEFLTWPFGVVMSSCAQSPSTASTCAPDGSVVSTGAALRAVAASLEAWYSGDRPGA